MKEVEQAAASEGEDLAESALAFGGFLSQSGSCSDSLSEAVDCVLDLLFRAKDFKSCAFTNFVPLLVGSVKAEDVFVVEGDGVGVDHHKKFQFLLEELNQVTVVLGRKADLLQELRHLI